MDPIDRERLIKCLRYPKQLVLNQPNLEVFGQSAFQHNGPTAAVGPCIVKCFATVGRCSPENEILTWHGIVVRLWLSAPGGVDQGAVLSKPALDPAVEL